MNIYYFIEERLNTIRHFYRTASAPFIENLRKIDADEPPFDTAPAGYEIDADEPAFLAEWEINKDGLTLLGHSAISMLQVSLKLYLDTYVEEVDRACGKQKWVATGKGGRDRNWFAHYKDMFLNVLGTDWDEHGKENVEILEQIALARDDIFHHSELGTVDVRQSEHHFKKYTESFFADEKYLTHYRQAGEIFPGRTWAIDVPPERVEEAIERVDQFCAFMEGKWAHR